MTTHQYGTTAKNVKKQRNSEYNRLTDAQKTEPRFHHFEGLLTLLVCGRKNIWPLKTCSNHPTKCCFRGQQHKSNYGKRWVEQKLNHSRSGSSSRSSSNNCKCNNIRKTKGTQYCSHLHLVTTQAIHKQINWGCTGFPFFFQIWPKSEQPGFDTEIQPALHPESGLMKN